MPKTTQFNRGFNQAKAESIREEIYDLRQIRDNLSRQIATLDEKIESLTVSMEVYKVKPGEPK